MAQQRQRDGPKGSKGRPGWWFQLTVSGINHLRHPEAPVNSHELAQSLTVSAPIIALCVGAAWGLLSSPSTLRSKTPFWAPHCRPRPTGPRTFSGHMHVGGVSRDGWGRFGTARGHRLATGGVHVGFYGLVNSP